MNKPKHYIDAFQGVFCVQNVCLWQQNDCLTINSQYNLLLFPLSWICMQFLPLLMPKTDTLGVFMSKREPGVRSWRLRCPLKTNTFKKCWYFMRFSKYWRFFNPPKSKTGTTHFSPNLPKICHKSVHPIDTWRPQGATTPDGKYWCWF